MFINKSKNAEQDIHCFWHSTACPRIHFGVLLKEFQEGVVVPDASGRRRREA
ncbi:MAG: hypothetical protein R2788_02535 [Saprospiraceae bacterium]